MSTHSVTFIKVINKPQRESYLGGGGGGLNVKEITSPGSG